jgi:hypothetical protein
MLLCPVVHDIRKRLCLFEVSQVSTACQSTECSFYRRTEHGSLFAYRTSICQDIRYNQDTDKKTNPNKMRRCVKHFWKNIDRANRKFWEKKLSQYHFVQHKSHMGSVSSARDRRLNLWAMASHTFHLYNIYIFISYLTKAHCISITSTKLVRLRIRSLNLQEAKLEYTFVRRGGSVLPNGALGNVMLDVLKFFWD